MGTIYLRTLNGLINTERIDSFDATNKLGGSISVHTQGTAANPEMSGLTVMRYDDNYERDYDRPPTADALAVLQEQIDGLMYALTVAIEKAKKTSANKQRPSLMVSYNDAKDYWVITDLVTKADNRRKRHE